MNYIVAIVLAALVALPPKPTAGPTPYPTPVPIVGTAIPHSSLPLRKIYIPHIIVPSADQLTGLQ